MPKQMSIAIAFVLFLALPVFAQSNSRLNTGSQRATPARTRQEPCWKEAGVSAQAMQQHRQIAENTRSQVESICADSSLTAQQKMQKIRQIRQQARAEMERLITPQQQAAIQSCREKRGIGAPTAGGHGGGTGPCGEMPMGNSNPPTAPAQPPKP